MIRMLYIVPQDVALAAISSGRFHQPHFIDLPDGHVLLTAAFRNSEEQDLFEAIPAVHSLPHPFDPTAIHDAHVDKLAHLGVKKGHKTRDVHKLAKKVHRLL